MTILDNVVYLKIDEISTRTKYLQPETAYFRNSYKLKYASTSRDQSARSLKSFGRSMCHQLILLLKYDSSTHHR